VYKYIVGGIESRKTKKNNIKTFETFSESHGNFSVARKKQSIVPVHNKKYNPKNCNVLFCLLFPLIKKRNASTKAVSVGSNNDIN
jgi:hypothetical protein